MFKHTTRMFALLFVFASITMFIGCQEQQSVVTPENGFANLNKETNLVIPNGATVVSAHLKIFQLIGNNTQNNIHRVTAPWLESTVTGNNFGAYDPSAVSFFNTASSFDDTWNSVDVTSLVLGWLNGSFANNGLLIDQLPAGTGPDDRSVFYSKENTNPSLGERMPYLEIVFSNGDVAELGTIGDAYITEGTDQNTGSTMTLNTGYANSIEKQTLIQFDIDPTLPQCYQDKTAWVANAGPLTNRYVTRGNWATWISYSGSKVYNIYAGQTTLVGTASLSPNVDPTKVDIVISLTAPWALDVDVTEGVKIQGYANIPPARNPNPGGFTTYKGNSLSVTVAKFNYYGIHLDVSKPITCPE